MSTTVYPQAYLTLNKQTTKKLNVVVQFDGLSTLFSLVPLYQKVRYGDPRLKYGLPGLVYGGLILTDNVEAILKMDSGLSITQQIEPEQGRGSVATMSLQFIDLNGIMSKLISPGILLEEPLVNTLVTVSLGYANSSFPEDYYKVFRGYITKTISTAGLVTLELSDANIKRRQTIFLGATTSLSAAINNTQVIIPVTNAEEFILQIQGPDGIYDPSVTTYVVVDDEVMTYAPNTIVNSGLVQVQATFSNTSMTLFVLSGDGIIPGQAVTGVGIDVDTVVTAVAGTVITISKNTILSETLSEVTFSPSIHVLSRGGSHSRGTPAIAHDAGAVVTNTIQFQGNLIDLALKIMLSGFDGPWKTGVNCTCLGTSLDPFNVQNNAIVFPAGIDVVDDYGLAIGDYITVTGSVAGNNGTFRITEIQDDLGDTHRMVIVNGPLFVENPATPVELSFRSQYDTFPSSCGLQNTPQDTDVATFRELKQLIFSAGIFENQIYISDTQNGMAGKDLIEGTIFLPSGLYTVTRYGRISVAVTLPPIAQQNMVFLTHNNVLSPDKIQLQRAVNDRRFYNVIQYNYDLDDQGDYLAQSIFIDNTSPDPIDIESVLPINADGVKSGLGGATMVQQRGLAILNRYKRAAYEITLDVNWSVASLIEVGDIVALQDEGNLQITNLETGIRNLGTQLFEVIQRQLDIKSGTATLTLLSSVGYALNQRYATISPSSTVVAGSTLNSIEIEDSFGGLYPGDEKKKWTPLIGLPIHVHDPLYVNSATAVLDGFSPSDNYRMLVSPDLPFVPQPGDQVDIVSYGTGTNASFNALYKTLFAFIDSTLSVISGVSQTEFFVSTGDAAQIQLGKSIFIHNADYTLVSTSCPVQSVDLGTGQVIVSRALGFTPTAGQLVEAIGFPDGGNPYLFL